MKELQAHFGKKTTTIKIRVPLTQEERDILKEALFKIIDKLKIDKYEITETKPYKNLKRISPIEEDEDDDIEMNYEEAMEHFRKLDELLESFEKKHNS